MYTLPPWLAQDSGDFAQSFLLVVGGGPLAQHNSAKKLKKSKIKRVYFALVRNIFFYQKTKQPVPMLYPQMIDTW